MFQGPEVWSDRTAASGPKKCHPSVAFVNAFTNSSHETPAFSSVQHPRSGRWPILRAQKGEQPVSPLKPQPWLKTGRPQNPHEPPDRSSENTGPPKKPQIQLDGVYQPAKGPEFENNFPAIAGPEGTINTTRSLQLEVPSERGAKQNPGAFSCLVEAVLMAFV